MATRPANPAIQLVRRVALEPSTAGQDDELLLNAFLTLRDPLAFEALVRTHGPMVLNVCRRALNDYHAAEDAFQATFLHLAQQAGSIRKPESLASWLHGVGLRMAGAKRKALARRRRLERQARQSKDPIDPAEAVALQEVQRILHEEVQALAAADREPFIRCCLEHATSAQVASQLGVTETTVRKRLERARAKLRLRLEKRGVCHALVAGLAAVGSSPSGLFAGSRLKELAALAVEVAQGRPVAQAVPKGVSALIAGANKAVFFNKLTVTGVLVAALIVTGGALGLAGHSADGSQEQPPRLAEDELPALEMGHDDAIRVPTKLSGKIGVLVGEVKPRVAAKPRVLELPGSTTLDPASTIGITARCTPCKVIEIGMKVSGDGKLELRPGDPVVKGQPLAVLESATVGLKKTELHDALVKLKLDEQILERAEKAIGAVPEVFILNAKKSVLADLNAVTRVRMGLTALGVDETDLEQVDKEASRTAEKEKADTKEERETRLKEWSRLTLKAPVDGVLIERNIIAGEVLIDGTIKLFRLAKPERLLVLANCPEAELPGLRALKPEDRWWSIKVGDQKPVEGAFDQVGAVVDPDTHTGVVKGGIENKAGLLRAGQYVTARISLPMANEWSLQAAAVVEENGQYFVFVQPDAKRPVYEQRRVLVLRRGQDVVHIRAEPTAEEVKQGVRTVRAGERVVISGAVELKALMDDLKRP